MRCKGFLEKLRRLRKTGGLSVKEFIQALKVAWTKINALDDVEIYRTRYGRWK